MLLLSNLSVEHLSPTGPLKVLNSINLEIQAGERIGLMGPNGSGKTTLVRCLNGLLQPTRGEVKVDGLSTADERNLKKIRRLVGMVFQNPENQIVTTTVEHEIAFGLENLNMPREEMHKKIEEMLTRFDLERFRTHPPHLLSGGEMQRLAVAAVIAMAPRILVLDEPTSLLDPQSRQSVINLIDAMHAGTMADAPMTTLIVTQFPLEALSCNRLLVMNRGRIVLDGPPVEIFRRSEQLSRIGVRLPMEFEIVDYLEKISHCNISLNPTVFLPIT